MALSAWIGRMKSHRWCSIGLDSGTRNQGGVRLLQSGDLGSILESGRQNSNWSVESWRAWQANWPRPIECGM